MPGADPSPTTAPGADPARRGMLLAFGAATATAVSLVPFKLATEEAEPEHVVVALLVAAATFNSVGSVVRARRLHSDRVDHDEAVARSATDGDDEPIGPPPRRSSVPTMLWVGLVLGLLGAGANFMGSEALSRLDASVGALLIQMQVLFAAALGWLWLGEHVTRRFMAGTTVALLGVAVMQGGGEAGGADLSGVLWGLAAAACFGSIQVVTRRVIDRIEPVWVNALRLWISAALVASVPGSLAGALDLDAQVVAYAAAAAFCGPFIGRLMMMASARYIPAALSTFIGLSSPVIALLGDWLFLDGLPGAREWLGGAVVGAGMVIAVRSRGGLRLRPAPVAS